MKGGGLPELLSAIVVCIVLFFLRLFHDFAAVNSLLSFKIPMPAHNLEERNSLVIGVAFLPCGLGKGG